MPANSLAYPSRLSPLLPRLSPARLLLLAVVVLALGACEKAPPPKAAATGGPPGGMPAPEVSVITVQAAAQPVEYEYAGQTAGSRETEVRARVAGILQRRLYEEGASVKAGSPMFQIDPASFQAQLTSAEAAVALADAKLNQAKRDNARLVPLIAEKAISQKEFDDSRSALELAEASLKQSRAQAAEARLNLSYTKVLAPISGVTGAVSKSDGSLVTAADSLLTTIVQTNPIFVNFSVSESEFLKLNKQVIEGQLTVPGKRANNGSLGFTVQLKLADGSTFPRTGKLNFASEKVNAQTGNIEARAEIPNPEGNLRPGQFVRVKLGGASRTNVLTVPQRAVIDSPFGKIVFVVSPDNKLAPRPVELDGWTQGQWIVSKGLQSGERVLVEGFIKANTPGMTVKPVPYVAASAGAANAPKTTPSAAPPAPAPTAVPPASSAASATPAGNSPAPSK
jgi:membrane fusion protein, multidrug efflux system